MKYNIIKTENYLIIADDSEIKRGDYRINIQRGYVKLVEEADDYYNQRGDLFKKVIAHLPLNDSPILEGVDLLPLLPPLEDDDLDGYEPEFVNGFRKAKEKYKWAYEDVINIIEKSRETGFTAEYLVSSLTQPKYPITFELDLDALETNDLGNGYSEFIKPLQKRWIGKYIY